MIISSLLICHAKILPKYSTFSDDVDLKSAKSGAAFSLSGFYKSAYSCACGGVWYGGISNKSATMAIRSGMPSR